MRRLRGFLDRTRVLAALLAAIAAVSVAGAYWAALARPGTSLEAPRAPGGGLHAELYVYKNGELVYYDPDDPATDNLAYVMLALLDNSYDGPKKAVALDGTTHWWDEFVEDFYGVVLFGQLASFSRSLHNLDTVYAKSIVDEVNSYVDSEGYHIVVGASWTVPTTAGQNYTITGVALAISAAWDENNQHGQPTSPGSDSQIAILFADVLSQPVTLQPGDTIHVRYVITLP